MAVAADALLVAHGLGKGLAQGDADVLHRVVAVDVQVALAVDIEVDQAMARDLVEHVVQKADARAQAGLASPCCAGCRCRPGARTRCWPSSRPPGSRRGTSRPPGLRPVR